MMDEIRWEAFENAIEYGGTLQFSGSEREIAEAFLLAAACLRDKVYSGGQIGIDYEQLSMPTAPSAGEGFGGWLINSLPTLLELREIAHEALDPYADTADEWKARAWLAVRRPGPDACTERGFVESSLIPKTTVHRGIVEVDSALGAALRDRGYVVRGRTRKAPDSMESGATKLPGRGDLR